MFVYGIEIACTKNNEILEQIMRVTNALVFNSSLNNYRTTSEKLYNVNQQIATKTKIQNSYENTGVYIDAMRLNNEIETLEQSVANSSKAKSFAENTDLVLNDFTKALDTFKTKLIQSANATNSSVSHWALANDLRMIKNGLMQLSNTSINGQFLFSGSALSQKPIDSNGQYKGNGETLKAFIGSGVELPYNIDGKSLFMGKDSDYNRAVSTNVTFYNQKDLHPNVMMDNFTAAPKEKFLAENDTIRDMVGDKNSDATDDSNAMFYLAGRNTRGETFSTKIEMNSAEKVSDLLERIGIAYGNSSANKLVSVTLNERSQIEIKDLTSGNQVLEMHIFGAVDRNAAAGTSGNANQNDIDNLLGQPNVDLIGFNVSEFSNKNKTATSIASRQLLDEPKVYKVGYPLEDNNGAKASSSTLLRSLFPTAVDNLLIGATALSITPATTVQDLINAIQTEHILPAGSVNIENGQLSIRNDSNTPLSVTIQARGVAPVLTPINAFTTPDFMNYTRRGFDKKDGNEIVGNIPQVNKKTNEYATSTTKISDVAGISSLDGKRLNLNFTDKNGIHRTGTINFDAVNTTFTINYDEAGTITAPNMTFSILNGSGGQTAANDMTYKQLTDLVGMLTSGVLPTIGVPLATSTPFETYNYALATSQSSVDVTLDHKGRISILDKTSVQSKIELSMYDNQADQFNGTASGVLSFMANDSVTISNPSIDMFSELDEIINAVEMGRFRMDSSLKDPRNRGIQNALSQLDHIADHVIKAHTKIGALTSALSDANTRSTMLGVNVKIVQHSVITTDQAEAYLEFQSVKTSYEAMLSTIAKVNSMSLLNYL